MIVSTVAGRIRVRNALLKSSRLSKEASAKIKLLDGVTDVRANSAAGSIVVNFDASSVDVISLEDQIEEICLPSAKPRNKKALSRSKRLNQATKIGMMSTLAASLGYAAAGKKKPHIRYGVAFVGFAGLHMWKYSDRLVKG